MSQHIKEIAGTLTECWMVHIKNNTKQVLNY